MLSIPFSTGVMCHISNEHSGVVLDVCTSATKISMRNLFFVLSSLIQKHRQYNTYI